MRGGLRAKGIPRDAEFVVVRGVTRIKHIKITGAIQQPDGPVIP